ncbi:hypothetical protein COX74_01025 [bacterium (Candidatus Gribaldobacteria) CG_4_10_14_0_2_um_filter_41_16]|uniref:Cohesin domain-containing protein n=1 Tax=bacterium (Candidatus Gribaldobacteria) CG_4_10_14_0_2_um_filter_41_16 TaxID=2014265 RepID=A0A2M7VIU7_9BACT|nr:MAG: hypothetical protein COX74_01025 [bacterium (Candidatus Gribaldobacteria) CG_4_10_14_0_2_um_filter_41_16]
MKNTKTKIILSAIIFSAVIGFVGTANAAGASLYISPATLTKTAGDTFNVSVGFNASGNKVCAVEGTLVFNNLTCQSITMAGDVTPQSSPTCANPYFLIGVPSCTTADKVLLTVLVKAGSASTASIGLTSVDIIGEGVSVGSASVSASYTISAVPAPAPTPKPNPMPMPVPKTKIIQENGQPIQPQPTPQPTQQIETSTQVQPTAPENNLLADVATASPKQTTNILLIVLVIVAILGVVAYGIYRFEKSKKKQP